MEAVEQLLMEQSARLFYYSPYNFIREIHADEQYKKIVQDALIHFHDNENHAVIEIIIDTYAHFFYVRFLPWDSNYFQIATYKLFTVLYQHTHFHILCRAILAFKNSFIAKKRAYCFMELPAEDILLIQAFTHNGFNLTETRFHYYMDTVQCYNYERFAVRMAGEEDIPQLKKIAAETRNAYDRIHADPCFSSEMADQYLATYAEQAVKGLANMVLVPDEKGVPPGAFVAISYLTQDSKMLNCQLARVMLSTVAPSCQGWHYKLVSEAVFQAKSIGAAYLLMTTQSTNRAVISNSEKLGFRLGGCTHILSDHISDYTSL